MSQILYLSSQYGLFLGIPLLFLGIALSYLTIVAWFSRPTAKQRYQADSDLPLHCDNQVDR
jgi:hypothetical protein